VFVLVLACSATAFGQPAQSSAAAPLRVALLPTHTSGVDPTVAGFVDRALARGATALGYTPLDSEQGKSAQQQLALTPPLGLADLWRVTHYLQAELGVSAIASADRGYYAVHIRVASSDGRGPFHARGEANQIELEASVIRLLAQALAQARAGAPEGAVPGGSPPSTRPEPAGVEAGPRTESRAPQRAAGSPPHPEAAPASAVPVPVPAQVSQPGGDPRSPPARPRFRLALHNDVAFGVAEHSFVNEVLGARADLRLDTALWLGLHAGYANLQGRTGRVHGFLPYAQVEQRMALAPGRGLAIPLRLGLGYLLRNGGFLRLSSGVAVPLGARTELVVDLFAPAFWVTRAKTLFSLDAAVELNVEL
jgi:hypothetical protein